MKIEIQTTVSVRFNQTRGKPNREAEAKNVQTIKEEQTYKRTRQEKKNKKKENNRIWNLSILKVKSHPRAETMDWEPEVQKISISLYQIARRTISQMV